MRKLALLAVLAPTIAAASPSEVAAELSAAIRAKNTKAVTKLLAQRVFTEGLWFPDSACAKKFAAPQVVEKGKRAVLAGCLAKLEMQASTRGSTAVGGAVLTAAPGIELEIGTVGSTVYHVSNARIHVDGRPTLTMQAFEALRTKGSLNIDTAVATELAAFTKKVPRVEVSLEVCLDAKGKPAIEVAAAPIPSAGDVVRKAVADWAFSPFVVKKAAIPACGVVTLVYPSKQAGANDQLPFHALRSASDFEGEVWGEEGGEVGGVAGDYDGVEGGVEGGVVGGVSNGPPPPPPPPPPAPPQNIPPTLLEGQRVAGDKAIVPDEDTKKEITRSGKDRIIGSYKLCVTAGGDVQSINQLKSTGFPAYDAKIQRGMRTWKYRPYIVNGKTVPVCTAVTFIYSQK